MNQKGLIKVLGKLEKVAKDSQTASVGRYYSPWLEMLV